MLSEELDPSQPLSPLAAINTTSLQHIQALLASPHFAPAVFSIAAAHAAAVPALRQLGLGAVAQVCAAAAAPGRLLLVERLCSRVVLRSSGRDVTRDTASRQVGVQNTVYNGMLRMFKVPHGDVSLYKRCCCARTLR
jgi:hypothetical protein